MGCNLELECHAHDVRISPQSYTRLCDRIRLGCHTFCMDCLSMHNKHLKWKLIHMKNNGGSSIISYMIISIHVSRLITIITNPWNNVLSSSISHVLQSVSLHEYIHCCNSKCRQRLKRAQGDSLVIAGK
jgi:hypothetical protein